ncbi:MAG: nucleotidyltransferase [Rhodospirillaceae bacterium]|nr:nucleotidyltransferase [Rhodospirillaceae bacterium]
MPPQPDITALLLAGGQGTRVRHLLGETPKPMAPVAGRPFIEWILRHLAAQGIRHALLSTGHQAKAFADHFDPQPVPNLTIECIAEPEPLGTAGGLRYAARQADHTPSAWLVLNGDSLAFLHLPTLAASLEKSDAVLAARNVPDTTRYGSLQIDTHQRLQAFREKQPGAGLINAGIYLLRPPLLENLPDKTPLSLETEAFPDWLRAGHHIQVTELKTPFLDIGTPETLPQAETFITDHLDQFLLSP